MEKYPISIQRLRRISDEEYEYAQRLAGDTPLHQCPTCKSKPEEVPDSGGVKQTIPGTFRFRGKEYACDCDIQKALRIRYLAANIGAQYQKLDWNDFQGTVLAKDAVDTYLALWENFKDQGFGLEFGGKGLGTGKTWAAIHIGKELIKRGQQVYFIPFVEMVAAFDHNEGSEVEDRIRQTPYVILDEILPAISDRQREFFAFRFEAIIRHRTNNDFPTIITTNMTQDELHKIYPRVYSVLAAKQDRIDMSGEDARVSLMARESHELILNGEVRPRI